MPLYLSKNIFLDDSEDNRYIVKWDSMGVWIEDRETGGRLEHRQHNDLLSCNVFNICRKLNGEL